jgi:ADP-heptose:LPS heptosyltransferase
LVLKEKILLIRFSSIGDIVLTTPVIRCLRKQLPQAEIHFLTKPQYKSILEPNPYLDKIHVLDTSPLRKGLNLRDENYTHVIDLHHNLRTLLFKQALGAPSSSYNKLNIEKFIRVYFKKNILPPIHIVDRYLATAAHLGVENDGMGLDYFIPESVQTETINGFNLKAKPYLAWAIGAQHFTKQLPVANICKKIIDQDLIVVLLGGKEDVERAALIEKTCGEKVVNLCGKISLHQSAWLLKQAQVVHTNDTGLMHIAAAFNKSIISYWGNTVPEFGMTPYLPKPSVNENKSAYVILNQVKDLACRPCSKIGFDRCPKGHFNCMTSL